MTQKDKVIYSCFMSAVAISLLVFASFWFNWTVIPSNFKGVLHILDFVLFAVVTYVIWHPIFMKVCTFIIAGHIKKVRSSSSPLSGQAKVAFITTFVPASESIELLHRTLPAMISADYAHDTWLLDEGNDPAVREICEKYGVNHFSRNGVEMYNQTDGKFARRTKGGNHNSWYDRFGNEYDFVAQIDTDFVPKQDFLTKTLSYFNDSKIAFVGTPQIYGNIEESFIAHGAAEQTYSFYGPLLRGMSGIDSSMLIGANHVIRVAALRSVDHYSAHITEDLLTGMKLHANGWKSVYHPEPLAIGEGPTTWKAYFSQQKRWAYGCMHILFTYSPLLLRKMQLRQALYYFCIQQYYFSGVVAMLGVTSLCLYFYTGLISVNMDLFNFLTAYLAIVCLLGGIDFWMQRFNARPKQEKGVMWFGMLVGVAVWPIYFQAFCALFKQKKLRYKVTPKGKNAKLKDMSLDLFLPHFLIGTAALSGAMSSSFTGRESALMIFWSLVSGVSLLGVPLIPHIIGLRGRIFRKQLNRISS